MDVWLGLKRPLMLAFFLGCTVSILTSRALTLRLLVPAMAAWAFLPLIEVGALAIVCRKDRHGIPFSSLIDKFFQGFGPWLFWMTGMCGIWAVLSPASQPVDWTISVVWLDAGVLIAAVRSLYIDFGFFQSVLQRSRGRARRDLILHRAVSWSLILGIVGGPTIWSELTGRLW
jgi:hypothetical protein